ncbi:MAG: Crp/Fnr family transcriptional regulator [Chroococcidiopsidaceae cyanobacterium CP_BM_ER_R8_30]|nr:Crp/Fnr family transcriptional regulator [Chroococcidiopsidaceae cyanobacterium CP_BM_ER_R8_30]
MTVSTLPTWSSNHIRQTFARRSLLPLKQDCLWQITTGVVRTLTWLENGNFVNLGLWGPGDIVGRALSNADPLQIECLTPVEVTLLPARDWHQATEAMILHIQRSGELIEILHCRQAEVSLLQLLAWLAKRFGQEVEQGKLINLGLTHQDLAEMIGLTRVTVTRLLNAFEKQGIIQRKERQSIILHEQSPFWHYEI